MESAKYLHYKKKVSRGGSYLLKVLLGIFISAPIIICLMLALKQPGEFLTAKAAHLISEDPTLDNFKWIMDNVAVGTYLKNTLIQCTIVIIAQLVLCSFAAYALVFFEFKGKKLVFTLILVHMMIPGDVIIITNYIQMQHWHLTDTHLGMALPYLVGGMGIFLMRQFYLTLPRELKEASELSYAGAHYLCERLLENKRFSLTFPQPFFNEFCVTYDGDVSQLQKICLEKGFMAGVQIDEHTLMFAVTEQRTKEEIDELVNIISSITSTK